MAVTKKQAVGLMHKKYRPVNGMLMENRLLAGSMKDEDTSYDLDIEPDDIEVTDTVTVVWEIG